MTHPTGPAPRLAPPGAGVPFWQRWAGKYVLLPRYARRLTWDGVPDLLETQGRALLDLARGYGVEQLERRVLVPRQVGLEDSSRYHSYAMVLEHLTIVGTRVADVVCDLTHSRPPLRVVRTADLKPRALRAPEATRRYAAMLAEFRVKTLDPTADRNTSLTFEHPWFGLLSAFQWMCFAPFHQTIHERQAREILRLLS